MSHLLPHATDPARTAPALSAGTAPPAGEPGPFASLRLPGVLFVQAWSPFRFAVAHLLIGLAPVADLLGLGEWARVDLVAWAGSVDATLPHTPPQEDGRTA
jgi:hypothetical protein